MGAWRTRLSGAPAEAARPGACKELLCGGFRAHACVLFDAGPLAPMHGRSGAAGRTCFDCTPSIGTRVLSSVSAFGGCSFALGCKVPLPSAPVLTQKARSYMRRAKLPAHWQGNTTNPQYYHPAVHVTVGHHKPPWTAFLLRACLSRLFRGVSRGISGNHRHSRVS
jgi:hypothetical protein